jgi:hypothetical protein
MKHNVMSRHLFTCVALTLGLFASARADTITLLDGKTFDNVTITSENLKEVSFKQDGKNKTTASDGVADIEYKKKPKLVDQADVLARDGDIGSALDTLEIYVKGIFEGNNRESMVWAPAYAMQRRVELCRSIGDGDGVIEAANYLIAKAPESRNVLNAYLAKATAQADARKYPEALATIGEMRKLIDTQSLSQRWKLEADLAAAMSDPALAGAKRRARVIEIAGAAGTEYPTVANRARVAEGESYLEGENRDFAKAKSVFQAIVNDPSSDKPTLAGAYTGLGDCLFAEAIEVQKANQDATPGLNAAVDAYMRVVVLYPEQVRYRAKSMFWAGRAFEFLGDDISRTRARQLYRSVMRDFRESKWAGDAKKQLGG